MKREGVADQPHRQRGTVQQWRDETHSRDLSAKQLGYMIRARPGVGEKVALPPHPAWPHRSATGDGTGASSETDRVVGSEDPHVTYLHTLRFGIVN